MKYENYNHLEDLSPQSPLVHGLKEKEYRIVNHEYQRMISRYERAVEELDLMFLNLKQKLDRSCDHVVIQSIRSRIKSADSMCEKIVRLKKPCTLPSIQKNLYDIAGLRIICSYIDDIYDVVRWIQNNREMDVMLIKDYIKNPKPSGYRSLHVIFSMKVFDSRSHTIQTIYCEIQLRTAAMDAWAALEHQLQYKNGDRIDPEITQDLRDCAARLNETDLQMQEIFRKLQESS